MFTATAELYDLIYSRLKDYPAEVERLVRLLREVHPSAKKVLDVGCGTGQHARLLTELHGFSVDGIDLEPVFVRLASQKLPNAVIFEADMRDFRLDRRYDAVLCLFSSIAYVRTLDSVTRTLVNFRRHLATGGVVVVEPWFVPAAIDPGRVTLNVAEDDTLTVCRMAHVEVEGRLSRLRFDYLVGRRSSGVEHLREKHVLGLFTVDEMLTCFRDAGLEASYDEEGLFGRGLYVARPFVQ